MRHLIFKPVASLILFILTLCEVTAQYPLVDALRIRNTMDTSTTINLLPQINSSVYGLARMSDEEAHKHLNENKFLGHIHNQNSTHGADRPFYPKKSSDPSPTESGILSSFTYGLTDFLIERAREELSIAFFHKFKKDLDCTEYGLFLLFPSTKDMLHLIDKELFHYDHYLNALRHAFKDDLSHLTEHLPAYINHLPFVDSTYEQLQSKLSLLQILTTLATPVFHAEKMNIAEHMHLTAQALAKDPTNKMQNSFILATLISQSLRAAKSAELWIDDSQLDALAQDTTLFNIYLGLTQLYSQNYESTEGKFWKTVEHQNAGDNKSALFRYLSSFHAHLVQIEEFTAQQTLAKSGEVEVMDKKKITALKINTLNHITQIVFSTGGLVGSSYQQFSSSFAAITDHLISMAAYQQEGNLLGIVSEVSVLLNKLCADHDCPTSIAKLSKYGIFMANMVMAETPEDAKKAIEAVALPVGSYTIKRGSRTNVSLNGFTGAFYGQEQIINSADAQGFNNVALSLPVGISFSRGGLIRGDKKTKNPSSITLLASIIDLGTVASYRVKSDDEASDVPDIQLDHILAPGVHLELGIGGTPITIGGGVQMGPRLRDLIMGDESESERYWRYGFTALVDIPLVTVANRPLR